nr:nuclear-pore anchor-like [Ziziphus jujuba var. spinosa]
MNSFETTDVVLDDPMPVPKIPIGVSGTALAASLLRDGWSRNETNDVLARNMEYSQLIVDYQRKLKESSESLHAAQEVSRRLSVEVSLLKHEKEIPCSLAEKVYSLQQEARAAES